ncbi:hypothetical protein BJ165DRAFT_32396 [Panaeolus papilionaceus]|nr:hypothetical protein BJ165DRAFT_32396 [Panaeolus papilionaceus]
MNLSVSGEIPLTSWFAKKPAQPRPKQRPIKRRPIDSQLDSSPPVKKSRSISASSKLDESAPSSSKKASIMNYLHAQPSRRAQVPHTPQLKSLARADACLPTPPDSVRPAIKPLRAIPALMTRYDTLVEDDTIFTARPDSRPSASESFSPATSAGSSDMIELSDSEDPCDALEIPFSQSQEMGGAPIPSPDDFVGSSQSQLLDVWENPSPRKNKRLRSAIAIEPTLESIPSSQSQEWDLGTTYHPVEARLHDFITYSTQTFLTCCLQVRNYQNSHTTS